LWQCQCNTYIFLQIQAALTALEQGDLEALGGILARNNQPEQQQFRLDDPLDGGLYALFEPRLRLLDVALMLGRKRAAEMLIENGAMEHEWAEGAKAEDEEEGGINK
jgi:hypothetical protein